MGEPVEDHALCFECLLEAESVIASDSRSVEHLRLKGLGRDDDHAQCLSDEAGLVETAASVVGVHEVHAVGKGLRLYLEFDALIAQPAIKVSAVFVKRFLSLRVLGSNHGFGLQLGTSWTSDKFLRE